jgi:hypothetical protein
MWTRRWRLHEVILAEQTHILAATIQLFPVGLDVLYAVDYTGAIDNSNEAQFWTSTQWVQRSAVLAFQVFYKKAGMELKCFHNRGHPERWSPKDPSDFNALEG